MFGPQEFLFVTFPGTAYTSLPWSIAHRAVIRVPLYSPASITSTPTLIPLKIRFRMGKFCGAGNVPSGYSLTIVPPVSTISSASRLFSFGYTTSIPVPHTATVFPPALIAALCATVSTPRAIPLWITIPRFARSRLNTSAIPAPYGDGCLVPTTATPGRSSTAASPRIHSTAGGSKISSNRSG